MFKWRTITAFFCLLLVAFEVTGQASNPSAITQKRGLSHHSVTGTIIDRHGFLWIATRDGLNKFDGHQVTPFYTQDRELGTITDNYFNSIFYSGGDSIFLGAGNLIYAFNILTNQFHKLPIQSDLVNYEGDVNAFFKTKTNELWLSVFGKGLIRFDRKDQTFHPAELNNEFENSSEKLSITSIVAQDSVTLFLGTQGNGLIRFNTKTGEFRKFSLFPASAKSGKRNSVRSLTRKNNHELYVGTWGHGLWTFDLKSEQLRQIWYDKDAPEPYPFNDVRCLFTDADQTVWFGTNGGGIYHLSQDGNQLGHYSTKADPSHFLADNDVYSIFRERKGIYWIGTDGAGLQQINLNRQVWQQMSTSGQGVLELNNNDVQRIFFDSRQNMWVATNGGGINFISADRKTNRQLSINPNGLRDNTVYTVTEDQNGRIWIGSNSGGIQVYYPDQNRFVNLEKLDKGPYSFIYMLFADSRGDMWVSGYTDNFIIEKPGEKLNSFHVDSASLRGMSGSNFQAIMEDRRGNVWIGTNSKGVFWYDPSTKKLTSLTASLPDNGKPRPRNITGLYEDRWDNIWITTSGTGLFCWVRSQYELIQITEKDGLLNNILYDLNADRRGNLWMTSPVGIGLVELKSYQQDKGYSLQFYQFNQDDGIQSSIFNRNTSASDKNGKLYFGGTEGITFFQPEQIELKSEFKPLVPVRLLINNEVQNLYNPETGENINSATEFSFGPEAFLISIDITVLEFSNPDKIRYAYKMEGLNEDWIETQSNHLFTFTALPAGDYTLKVKSTNTLGNWNDTSRDFKFTVHPPWWATWWAWLLYVVIPLIVIGSYVRTKSIKAEKDRKLLEYQVEVRTEELSSTSNELKKSNEMLKVQTERLRLLDRKKTELFTNISHEFRTPLTMILAPLEGMAKQTPTADVNLMLKNALRMSRLINQLLAIAKTDSGEIGFRPATYDFVGFVEGIVTDFAVLATGQNRRVSEYYPDFPVHFRFDADHMEKILLNLLSNSFKFTRPTDEIRVQITWESGNGLLEDQVGLIVEDSGIGIPREQQPFLFDRFYQVESGLSRSYEGSGIGLALVKELVLLHKGSIEVTSEPEAGTRIKILFPVSLPDSKEAFPVLAAPVNSEITREIPDLIGFDSDGLSTEIKKGKTAEPIRILVVEDNPDLQQYLKRLLYMYQVQVEGNGLSGLRTAVETVPDLIISDVMMPEMDGYTMTRELKSNHVTWHIPIIILTAKSSLDSKIAGLELGADAYLGKPFQTGELVATIENLLQSRERLKSIYISKMGEEKPVDAVSSRDDVFLQSVIQIINENLSNTRFGVEELAEAVHISRSQLNRKLSAVIDQSPNTLIKNTRMKQAKILLEAKSGTISEIAFQVGFDNLAYFSKCFRETYDKSPSEV